MQSPNSPALEALQRHANAMPTLHQLFDEQPQRAQRFSAQLGSVYLDFSKQRIDQAGFDLLLQRAEELQLSSKIAALFAGERINTSENRAALHTLLRTPESAVPSALGEAAAQMRAAHESMRKICDALHQGNAQSLGLVQARDVVNIGIGGSDLGPRLVCEALSSYHSDQVRVHFMTNVDAHGSAPGAAAGQRIAGAVYISCSGRGGPHFGAPSAEAQILQHALGDVPLVGFFAGGEIARHHLYGYTGVLTVFVAP